MISSFDAIFGTFRKRVKEVRCEICHTTNRYLAIQDMELQSDKKKFCWRDI